MKILLLNANLRGVGTYVRALNFGWALATADHDVTLCTVSRTQRTSTARSVSRGVTVLEMPKLGYRMLPGWGSGPLDIAQRIRLIRRGHFDIVYGFEYHPNVAWPVYLTWRGRNYRFLSDWCDWHAGASNVYRDIKLAHRVDAILEERIRYRAERVTVISTVLQQRAIGLGIAPERVTLIEEGVDTEYIRPLPQAECRAALGLPAGAPIIATITDANMERPVHILAGLRRESPDARLLVIGRRRPAVASAAKALRVTSAVIETGFIPDADLPRYLACADVCILPMHDTLAHRARWPHKVNDFLAAGKATVVGPVGDIAQLFVESDLGGTARMDSEFVEVLAGLLNDPDRREACGRRARQVAVGRLDWKILRQRIIAAVQPA